MKRKNALQEMIYILSDKCWVCGEKADTMHHVPPKAINPKITMKIPICSLHHKMLNKNMDYNAREKYILRSHIRKIEKAAKNIRRNILDKHRHIIP
jgi:hypothetical protein